MSQKDKNPGEETSEDDWAAAMAEQADGETGDDPGNNDQSADDDWAAAMAEQTGETTQADTPDTPAGAEQEQTGADTSDHSRAVKGDEDTYQSSGLFKPLTDETESGETRDLDMIMEIPVTLSVELGQTRLTIRELLDLAKGSIVELEGFAGEPMDILINGYLIAQGEVVVVDDKYGIRINEIVNRSERINKLHR